jgi:tetratricopeptide (TPR) repeat protein
MELNQYLKLSQIGLYNPQRLSDDVMRQLFVARSKNFDFILEKIASENSHSIPMHHLVIAQRGMGKTTLLKRMEVEFRSDRYKERFVPLLFPEEQYNLSNLAELWLNSLDTMADTLEVEKHHEIVAKIDKKVKELTSIKDDEQLANEAYRFFISTAKEINRRPILLIDNLGLVFDRLSEAEQFKLRALLMENGAPIVLGASAVEIEGTFNYGAPFYDAFQIHYLKKLKFEELIDLLQHLAEITDSQEVKAEIRKEKPRIRTIHQLTGGNPRTSVMLFKMMVKGFSQNINDDLEALLDEITPLYKARFEELSPQMQKIVDAIALHWDPMNLEALRNETRFENNQLSPQIKRLVEVGWLQKLDAYQAKGNAYEISERFFNIWFLMRRSTRRQKTQLLCLSKFLEAFYGEKLPNIAQSRVGKYSAHLDHITVDLAMAEAVRDENLLHQLKLQSYNQLKELSKENNEIWKIFDENEAKKVEVQEYINQYKKAEADGDYDIAEKNLLKVAEKVEFSEVYDLLGDLYQGHLSDYSKSEQAYLKAIENDENYASAWNGLGNLYQGHLSDYSKSEQAYLKAIENDENYASAWNGLGNLYQGHLSDYSKSEQAYLKAIEIDKNYAGAWYNLGNLYQGHLSDYSKSEQAYLKAIEIDENYAYTWNGLGNLYQVYLSDYSKSEQAYLKAIEIDENNTYAWNNLGNLYKYHLSEYSKSKDAYLKAIENDENNAYTWNNLGNLYQVHLSDYSKSEQAYLKAIEIDENNTYAWNGLGNLYQDYLHEFQKAEQAYLKALYIDKDNKVVQYNLVFLYRDKLQRTKEAKDLFESIEIEKGVEDSHCINEALFALYDRNEGIAALHLQKALSVIKDKLPNKTQDDWWRFAAIVHQLGYGNWLLTQLEINQFDIILAPYYVAIKALSEKNSEGYLNSKAVEIRESARLVLEKIKAVLV